jgi:hypothetical protein
MRRQIAVRRFVKPWSDREQVSRVTAMLEWPRRSGETTDIQKAVISQPKSSLPIGNAPVVAAGFREPAKVNLVRPPDILVNTRGFLDYIPGNA